MTLRNAAMGQQQDRPTQLHLAVAIGDTAEVRTPLAEVPVPRPRRSWEARPMNRYIVAFILAGVGFLMLAFTNSPQTWLRIVGTFLVIVGFIILAVQVVRAWRR